MLANTIFIEQLGEVPLYIGMGIQVMSAIVLGGMVGYDREKKMKSAGLKTNIMICLGATLYTVISLLNVKGYPVPVDPNRVGAQIVSGIGFLGAGAIIQGRGAVIGMTTAATIWVVAAIGYTIGIGYPICAAIFSLTVLIVLKWINPFYRFMESEKGEDYFHIELLSLGSVKKSALELMKSEKIEIDEVYEDSIDKKRKKLTLYLYAHPRAIERIVSDFSSIASVVDTSCHKVDQAYLEAAELEEANEIQELKDELASIRKTKDSA
jgi:putative Mg2+ transporter-C (MgtC) family protein